MGFNSGFKGLIWQLLYMFRASLSPIFRSTKLL